MKRHEAEAAFSKALGSLPAHETVNSVDTRIEVNMFVSVRSCRKHYLVRSYGVQPDLPCSECEYSPL
jgi:hypothetical protein